MSKEFEELVLIKLEQLDVLDQRTMNTDQIIQDVVLKKLDVLDERTLNLEEKNIDTDKTLKEISTELQNLNNKFTVFDYEINRKIDSLFDAFVVNTEKDTVHEEKLSPWMKKF